MLESKTGFFVTLREIFILILLAVLVFIIYSNSMKSPFVFDDKDDILDNPQIRLTRLSVENLTRAGLQSPNPKRLIANISFALNYYFHKYNVAGFHLVNIFIHITTGIFLYFFTKITLNIYYVKSSSSIKYQTTTGNRSINPEFISFFTSLIWLVHPIQIQSVTYIVQRMNSMAAMFYVLSLLLYANGRLAKKRWKNWGFFSCSILSGLLALGSKEISATLPFFILLYEWYFFQEMDISWLKRHLLLLAGLLSVLVLLLFIFTGAHPLERILSDYNHRDFTLTQRVLTEFRVVIFYLSLLMFPHPSRLNLDHDFSISHTLIDPFTTLISIVFITGLIGLSFCMAKKKRLFSFCILWFLGNLVIESSVIGLEIIFEHRNYLPSMLIILMLVMLVCQHIKPKWFQIGLLITVAILFSVWTYERNNVWKDDITLWRDCVEKSPDKARPHNSLGAALLIRENINEAIIHFSEALRIKPDDLKALNNMGIALAKKGYIEEATGYFTQALHIKPDDDNTHNNIGFVMAKQGNLNQAIKHYSKALQKRPYFAEANNNMGLAMAKQGNINRAIFYYSRALIIKPEFAKAHNNLGLALTKQGNLKKAIDHYFKALQIRPYFADAHNNLGLARAKQHRLDEAISHFSEALRIRPDFAEAHNNIGVALTNQGNLKKAISHFSEALRIRPDFAGARKNLKIGMGLIGKSDGFP